MNATQLLNEWEISLLIQYNSSINVVSTQRNNIEDTSSTIIMTCHLGNTRLNTTCLFEQHRNKLDLTYMPLC